MCIMKSHGSSYWSDFEMRMFLAVFGVLCLTQGVEAQSTFLLPCPPPFPDFESIFARTLQLNQRFRGKKLQMQKGFAKPPNCSCSPDLMSNIGSINANRCSRNSGIPKLCLTESTLSTTTRTTTTWTIGESPSTVSYNNRGRVSTTAAVIDESRTTTFEEESSTTGPIVPPLPGSTGIPTANPVKSKDDGITIVVIAVGAGVLLVVFLIGSLLMCRKRLCAASGALGAPQRHEKAQRQRSDCQPISAISQNDTFEAGYAPSMISSAGSIGSVNGGFGKDYVTNGRKWRPDFDSETGSEKSLAETKYILLREDSSASALSFSFHYNTLRTIENPHALMNGGFGESSTDLSLPRTMKRRQSEGNTPLDFIEEGLANKNALARKHSKDSLNSIEIYDRVTSPHVVYHNGMANGQGPPNSQKENAPSLETIDQADEAINLLPEQKSSSKHGVTNPTFRGDNAKPEPNWQDLVLEELKLKSKSEDEEEKYDSLVNDKNVHIFGYSNDSLASSTGTRSVLDPPAQFRDSSGTDFRDSSGTEISVAIVQPMKKGDIGKNNDEDRRVTEDSPEPSPSKKQPPPVAKKPQNGSVKQGLQREPSSEAEVAVQPAAAEAVPLPKHTTIVMVHDTPMTNGYHEDSLGNGHIPNGIENGGKTFKARDAFLHNVQQNENTQKPSAHVQPRQYLDSDTRL